MTGGSRGIGRAVADVLRNAGSRVLVVARDEARLQQTGHEYVAADVTREAEVEKVAARAFELAGHGQVVATVHCAGAFELARIAETRPESFDRLLAVNLRAAFLLMRVFLPPMLKRRAGHLVSIGSIAGRQAFPANGAYSASKFALRGLHAVLAAELRGTGVRATLIEPAATDTELWAGIDRQGFPDLPSAEAMLKPDAVAQAVLYAVRQPADVAVSNLLLERS